MYKYVSGPLHLLLFTLLLGMVVTSVHIISTARRAVPVSALAPTSSSAGLPAAPPLAEPGWSTLQPGLERRAIPIYDGQGRSVDTLFVWRLDQRYFRLDVAFDENPKSLETWQAETNAAIVLNGGYYSIENERYFPDGFIVESGAASGRSFADMEGMLAVDASQAELRWLVRQPYDASERLYAALQSFPILVQPGGVLGFGPERESGASARRTVIGQDAQGRILLMVAPQGYFTLHQLSAFLIGSGLNLDIALNLDGGGSTGILVADPREIIPSDRPLPFVILAYAR